MTIKIPILFLSLLIFTSCMDSSHESNLAASNVLNRLLGEARAQNFVLKLERDSLKSDWFNLTKKEGKVIVSGNSPVALCRGAYDYLSQECNGVISWSGQKIEIPETLPQVDRKTETPYPFRYYFNVVTHGYTTPYWGWTRWQQEIDWMAVHGINMPLIGGAHEAILARVFKQLGLTDKEVDGYFSGPAHFPWNRMGNLNGWDGPLPKSYFDKQIQLTHQMLDRMDSLGMSPIIHAFAGFVPKGIKRLHPEEEVRELSWGGGLPLAHNAFILPPDSPLFIEIGKRYIQEWEKEFGKGKFYLADSFNEMDVPLAEEPLEAQSELADFGKSVYQSIKAANPDAIWVMQGWTFPYHKDENGDLFWTPERLNALVSQVPDDKLLILDLANEYNHDFWKIDPSWKMYEGFFGKQWIYSFIPNMGGKVPQNGILETYATIPEEALNYADKKNLVGFGFAPEGIENNELIYELLSDIGWRDQAIELDSWIEKYCIRRYGAYPGEMKRAYDQLRLSSYGTFTDHPMHRYQFRPYDKPEGVEDHATVHRSEIFEQAVGHFLKCADQLGKSELYTYDAIELAVQYFGLVADERLLNFLELPEQDRLEELQSITALLLDMDRLLATHPNHNLKRWVEYASNWGDTEIESAYYESNAKRLITTWGGDPVNDYSGRVWSGLIRDYYVPRWLNYHQDTSTDRKRNMRQWEEEWIVSSEISSITPFNNPLKKAIEMYEKYK